MTRPAPGRSPGGTEASPTELWPPRLGARSLGTTVTTVAPSLQVAAGARVGCPGGAGGRARGSPAEGWAAPPASMSRRAA